MNHTTLQSIDPVDRFRQLCTSLGADSGWPVDRSWMRYAAQVVVQRPASPRATARAILKMTSELRKGCGWSDSLQTPIAHLVSASLVYLGDTPEAFISDLFATRRLLHESRLPSSNWYELKTVLVLRLLSAGKDTTPTMIRRLQDIYLRMRGYHWWLTGRSDLPACALLTSCPGDPSAIADNAEVIYQELLRCGIPQGGRLQMASNILPLSGISPLTIAHRYLEVSLAITQTNLPHEDDNTAFIAMLTLLDHEPQRIASRLYEIYRETSTGKPLDLTVDLALAADLCFLDLVRRDRHFSFKDDAAHLESIHELIRIQHAIAVLIADVPPLEVPYGPIL